MQILMVSRRLFQAISGARPGRRSRQCRQAVRGPSTGQVVFHWTCGVTSKYSTIRARAATAQNRSSVSSRSRTGTTAASSSSRTLITGRPVGHVYCPTITLPPCSQRQRGLKMTAVEMSVDVARSRLTAVWRLSSRLSTPKTLTCGRR
jgi:hypothetical protein